MPAGRVEGGVHTSGVDWVWTDSGTWFGTRCGTLQPFETLKGTKKPLNPPLHPLSQLLFQLPQPPTQARSHVMGSTWYCSDGQYKPYHPLLASFIHFPTPSRSGARPI